MEVLTKEQALALLPEGDRVGVYRDWLPNPWRPPFHSWWSRADVVFAVETFDVYRTNLVAGHPISIRDGGGWLYIEARRDAGKEQPQ